MAAVEEHEALDATSRDAVRTLIATVEQRDGAPPLSERAVLQLAQRRPGLVHLTAHDGTGLTGYAQLDGDTAELAGNSSVDALLTALERHPHLVVWAHGRKSPVGEAARARGYAERRVMWQLRRPLRDLPEVAPPAGVTVRTFRPGEDEDAWLAVNAAAFADHPEQGRWTRADLEAREAERWFDPAGFLVAYQDGELLGFHWTKIHPDGIGEVYVLGVAPAAQGMHLGPALLAAGLAYLAGRGVATVMLYVEQDNAAAMHLYEKFGFTRHDAHTQYEWRAR